MEITLLQGLLIALAAAIMGIENCWEFTMLYRPLPAAAITGIILGDPASGCIVGALTELAFAGLMPVGGASVPHGTIAGIMSAVLCISQGLSPTEALTLSLPFAYLMQYINLAKNTLMSFVNPWAERIAASGDAKKPVWFHNMTLGINMLLHAVVAFLCAYAAQNVIGSLVEMAPQTLLHGLELAGGLMPAVGFCMMLSIILKKELIPFLLLGFVLSCYMGASTVLPIALIGLSVALIYYFFIDKENRVERSEENDGI